MAGENRAGEPGYAHIVDCATGAEGPGMSVEVGWSKNPNAKVNWPGGLVSGDHRAGPAHAACGWSRQALRPGLEPSAPPSLASHPATTTACYALQWFAFAVIALVIYGLAMRKRLKRSATAQ